MSARIGSVTGRGLAANLGEVLPLALLYGVVALIAGANIVADVAAMGESVRLLVGGPAVVHALALGVVCLTAQIIIPYRPYARYMKVLTLVLFAYVAAAFSLRLPFLRPQRAPAFYLIIGGATLAGALGVMTPIDPIKMLVWSAVLNGIVAAPLMIVMMLVVTNRKIMGDFAASRVLATFGWLATALMSLVVTALLVTTLSG